MEESIDYEKKYRKYKHKYLKAVESNKINRTEYGVIGPNRE